MAETIEKLAKDVENLKKDLEAQLEAVRKKAESAFDDMKDVKYKVDLLMKERKKK